MEIDTARACCRLDAPRQSPLRLDASSRHKKKVFTIEMEATMQERRDYVVLVSGLYVTTQGVT